jgi:hypothetical protein
VVRSVGARYIAAGSGPQFTVSLNNVCIYVVRSVGARYIAAGSGPQFTVSLNNVFVLKVKFAL